MSAHDPGQERSKFAPGVASCAIPAVAIPLLIGVATHHSRGAVLITAGAFSVGFGAFQHLHRSRLLPMLLAAVGMCVSSWVGTVAGISSIASVIACAAWAFAYAAEFRSGRAQSWIALQCAIWLVISTAYPAHGLEALGRGSLILAGGLLQTVVIGLIFRITGPRENTESLQTPKPQAAGTPSFSDHEWRRFAVRAILTVSIATALYRWLSAQNAYWIPMTSVIVLRPGLKETFDRALARGVGTIAGIAAAGIVVAATSHSQWVLVVGVCVSAWASYAVFQVKYAYFAISLTAYVVFLLSLAGIGEEPLILHRVVFTMIGVVLTLGLHWSAVWIQRSTNSRPTE